MWKKVEENQIKSVPVGAKIRVNGVEDVLQRHYGLRDNGFDVHGPRMVIPHDWGIRDQYVVEVWEEPEEESSSSKFEDGDFTHLAINIGDLTYQQYVEAGEMMMDLVPGEYRSNISEESFAKWDIIFVGDVGVVDQCRDIYKSRSEFTFVTFEELKEIHKKHKQSSGKYLEEACKAVAEQVQDFCDGFKETVKPKWSADNLPPFGTILTIIGNEAVVTGVFPSSELLYAVPRGQHNSEEYTYTYLQDHCPEWEDNPKTFHEEFAEVLERCTVGEIAEALIGNVEEGALLSILKHLERM